MSIVNKLLQYEDQSIKAKSKTFKSRDAKITIRLSIEEKELFVKKCNQSNVCISEKLREYILKEIGKLWISSTWFVRRLHGNKFLFKENENI